MDFFLGFDPVLLIRTLGYLGIFVILFAESGLFFAFFLPGDSILFTAGLLASQGFLNIFLLIPLCFLAAVLGNNLGYAFGRRIGPLIFKKERSFLFKRENLLRTQFFYEKYGSKAIILARFLPVFRTFVPILAGVGGMSYSAFFIYNLIGGALWAVGLTLLGFFLGRLVPSADQFILPLIALIVLLSILPGLLKFVKSRKQTL